MEVLPDYRVTHDDAFHPDGSLWDAGRGPKLTYEVDFPEPGRYHVHMRAYSTGSEDNGMHVGINGNWPPDGRRMQWCSGKHRWTWSSAQRDSGGAGSCGIEKTIFLDIPDAGTHTIQIAAREDGVEVDRIVLIKDLSNNTKICSPSNATNISCRNGSLESADGIVDLSLKIAYDNGEPTVGDTVTYTLKAENLDAFDWAHNVEVEVSLDEGMEFVSSSSECGHSGSTVVCTLTDLEPTAPDESHDFTVAVAMITAGSRKLEVEITATETDELPADNVRSTRITVLADEPMVDVQVSMAAESAETTTEAPLAITLSVANPDDSPALNTQATITLPAEASLVSAPSNCVGSPILVCDLDDLSANSQVDLALVLQLATAGEYTVSATASLDNDADDTNNSDTIDVSVVVPVIVDVTETEGEGGDPETDSESETDSEPDSESETEPTDVAPTENEQPPAQTEQANAGLSSGGAGTSWLFLVFAWLAIFGRINRIQLKRRAF